MEKFPCLKEANIVIRIEPAFGEAGDYHPFDYTNIYQALKNVESLTICLGHYAVLDFEHAFPMFRKLRVLEVTCGFDILHEFIKKSTMLEDLKIAMLSSRLGKNKIHWKNPESVPSCLVSSLRSMSIHSFKG